MFHKMANAFLIECYKDEICECSDIEHVTMSLDRGQKDALFTIIHNNGIVEKERHMKKECTDWMKCSKIQKI